MEAESKLNLPLWREVWDVNILGLVMDYGSNIVHDGQPCKIRRYAPHRVASRFKVSRAMNYVAIYFARQISVRPALNLLKGSPDREALLGGLKNRLISP